MFLLLLLWPLLWPLLSACRLSWWWYINSWLCRDDSRDDSWDDSRDDSWDDSRDDSWDRLQFHHISASSVVF